MKQQLLGGLETHSQTTNTQKKRPLTLAELRAKADSSKDQQNVQRRSVPQIPR